jgi:hypothetical protein
VPAFGGLSARPSAVCGVSVASCQMFVSFAMFFDQLSVSICVFFSF